MRLPVFRGPPSCAPLRRSRALGVGIACALVWGCTSCGRGDAVGAPGHAGPPPAAVEVFTVEPEPFHDTVQLVGQLEADESVVLKSEVPGLIEEIHFQEGQEVAKGVVLFRLRDAEQIARLHEAEAQLALARDVARRTRELKSRSVAAEAQLERAVAELAVAEARVEVARVALDKMRVHAPFDGILGARLVSPGDRVGTNAALGQIDAVAKLQLVFAVPEIAVTLARVGAPVAVKVAPYPDETFPGEVYFVSPTLDPTTRRLTLKAAIPNPDRKLRPGLFANLAIELGVRKDALRIPEEAVAYDAGGSFVWRVGEGHLAERVPVQLGIRRDGRVEIKSGLAKGDTIVSSGTHKVVAGAPVAPVAPAAAAAGPQDGA